MKKLGIYIHIPFCLSKCNYCGFYSHGGSDIEQRSEYVDGLIEDIREYGPEYSGEYFVDSIFIGGGTPSILEAESIGRILAAVRKHFDVTDDCEITMESNPKTLTAEKLKAYRRSGVNRLSIGLQSFDDEILKILGRAHSVSDFEENFREARKQGFDNINVDLMFAVPGQTEGIWDKTLDKVIDLKPEHISFYSLQLEEGTPFFEMFSAGEIEQIDDETDRRMYHRAIAKLKSAGYDHYEISNCAREGFQCRHNLKYWSMDDYLGIGDSASSYMRGIRFTEGPEPEYHQNDYHDDVSEFVFTGLRKTAGIDFGEFERRYGRKFWDVFAEERERLTGFFDDDEMTETVNGLKLTEKGIDVSNRIMAIFV